MTPLDPEIAEFATRLQARWARWPNLAELPFADQRRVADEVRAPFCAGGPAMARREDLVVPGPDGDIRVRLQAPLSDARPLPVLVYLHGGGFTTFSLDTHDRIMREYAARAGVAVLGVDYALSPESKFPQALHEVAAVADWIATGGARLRLDPARIAIGGDSAGANLALSTALLLRDRGDGARLKALLLAYGFFDDDATTNSQRQYGQPGALLSTEELAGFLENYLAGPSDRDDPLALPAKAQLHGLPPSFHLIAECDPLADEDRAMAARMAEAGDDVRAVVYPGACHSFLEAVSISALAERAFAESAAWLRERLAG